MTEYVRAADVETGHHVSIPRAEFDRNPTAWRELKSPATYADGSPLPTKHRTSVDESAEKKSKTTDGGTAADTKEK